MSRSLALIAFLALLDCSARSTSGAPPRGLSPAVHGALWSGGGPRDLVRREQQQGVNGSTLRAADRRATKAEAAHLVSAAGAVAPSAPPASRYVTWVDSPRGPLTRWVAADAVGHLVVAERAGRWIEVDGSEWAVRTERVPLALPDCGTLLAGVPSGEAGAGEGEQVVLERTFPDGSGARTERVVVVSPRTDATRVDSVVVGVHLLDELLLVETDTWLDSCSAFPDRVHETIAFSLAAWRPVDAGGLRRRAVPEVLAMAAARLGPLDEPTHLGIGAVRPRFEPSGELVADYVVTVTPALEGLTPWAPNVGQLTVTSAVLPGGWPLAGDLPHPVATHAMAADGRITGFARASTRLPVDA